MNLKETVTCLISKNDKAEKLEPKCCSNDNYWSQWQWHHRRQSSTVADVCIIDQKYNTWWQPNKTTCLVLYTALMDQTLLLGIYS